MTTEAATQTLEQTILQTTTDKNPETVNQLVDLVKQTTSASKDEILNTIIKLRNEGKLRLTEPQQQTLAISADQKTSAVLWFWITIGLSLATLITVFAIPADDVPLVYIRYVLGTIFLLWLPGYAFIKALFPEQFPIKTSEKDLDGIERGVLSITMSLALVPMVGLLLNYTPWGIRLTPIVLSLVALTIVFALVAVLRERQMGNEKKP